MNNSMNVEMSSQYTQFVFQLSDSAKLYDDNDVHEEEDPASEDEVVAPINEPLKIIRDHWICPDADVMLVVEDNTDKKRIAVASIILRMASKVFGALLSSNFKEGVIFAEGKKNSSDPVELVLEDDNPEAMLRLCKILHHVRISPLDTKPAVRDIYDLAIVVDKYDCAEAMESWSGNVFTWWEPESEWNGGLYSLHKCWLIIATKLFGQPSWFHYFTSQLIFGWDPEVEIKTLYESPLADHLSVFELDTLLTQLLPARQKLTDGIMLLMNHAVANSTVPVDSLVKKMKHAGIHPLFNKIQKDSLATICSGLQRLGLPAFIESEYYNRYDCNVCKGELPTIMKSLDLIVEVVKSYCGGLCLDCVRNGDDPGPGSLNRGGSLANDKKKSQRECRNHPADLCVLLEHEEYCGYESD